MLEKGVTVERATQLFSMALGPLPGVATPTWKRDPSDFDGTPAISYLFQVWGSLTPEQRRAAAQLIEGISVPASSGPRQASARRNPDSVFRLASFGATAAGTTTGGPPAFDYPALVQDANGTLAGLLNVPPVDVEVMVDTGSPKPKDPYASTWSWTWVWGDSAKGIRDWTQNPGGKCRMIFLNWKFQKFNEANARAVATHETFHCYQQRAAQTGAAMRSVPPWIVEGEATWVMAAVVPAGHDFVDGRWNDYASTPRKIYPLRSEDAVGVFGHESDIAGDADVWPKLLPMIVAARGWNDAGPFSMLIKGHEDTYYSSWGPSYFETQSHFPWYMNGPGHPPTSGPTPDMVSVQAGTDQMLTPTGSNVAQLWQLTGDADVVLVTLYTGYGRLHDRDFGLDTELGNTAPLALCLKQGGCKCPDGTPGASLMTKPAAAPIAIGVDGGDVTGLLRVRGISLDEFCKKPDQKPPPAAHAGGGGGGGGSGGGGPDSGQKPPPPDGGTFGDTHVITFDGVFYDLQVVGEFTLVRSTKDDFLVQVRQVPAIRSRTASVNQAMATKLGGDTIGVAIEQGVAVLRINGKVVSGAPPVLKGGVISHSSTMFGDVYELTWRDGTVVRAQQTGQLAMNVAVRPAASRRGTLIGLLGDAGGKPDNDLVGLRGARLGSHASNADVNHSLADAWRITNAQSLFAYQPGQSTATFTDRNFPATISDPSKVADRAAAEKYCKEVEITDPHLLENCILDLAVTNDFVFGSEYAHAQQVLAARASLAGPPKALAEKLATLIMTGEIRTGETRDSASDREFQFTAKKDDVIWVHGPPSPNPAGDPDCSDKLPQFHPVGLTLLDPNGQRVGDASTGCEFGRRDLAATGTYTFKISLGSYKNEVAPYRIPIRFVRPDRRQPLVYGQTVSGTIEQKAAHDVYSFTGKANDVIKISGAGCDVGTMMISLIDPEGRDVFGIDCRVDSHFKLSEAGTYQLMVNSLNGEPAPYHFVFQGGPLK